MANKIETAEASTPIKSSADKFYHFFKYDMSDIVKIFPAAFTGAQILEGDEGTVGCVKQWNYVIGGIPVTVNARTEAIDDATKSIKWAAIEGDIIKLYKTFLLMLTVSEGSVKWTIQFEKSTLITPPPELYVTLFTTLGTLVDAYLLTFPFSRL